ncbi:DNA polymerase alpha/epsilon subunit B-domain-containing protein [Gilbertella persicaria]|uniref:DNA polymerase alpha/epsilon subunit B-domain-containing protein n=1 Tax=Gilbertella persicaria TaxID=101096 RepID=UPI00222121EE|nr:DNA polymerase alpha/epsilon subunit B-domain-containing protein [Gilbertella persicaria]KAI8079681.1 DNA polymerase alpha/epsilon subunit B-domain-containing protein [Gilbertella persicaria]
MSTKDQVLQFCSSPTTNHTTLDRHPSAYDELSTLKESLLVKKPSFQQQYASIYYVRLLKLRKALEETAKARWSSVPEKPKFVTKMLDVQPGQLCYMLGTVYLEMKAKPNVMHDLEDEESMLRPPTPAKYRTDNDVISLEDESGRIEITGSCLNKEFLVTGTIIGVLGKEVTRGSFEVMDICLPGMAEQEPFVEEKNKDPKYVALLSGLHIGAEDQIDLRTQLLVDFLTGELGSSVDEQSSSKISRVIVAGNSLSKPTKIAEKSTAPKKYGYDASTFNASPVIQLDDMLEEICSTVDLDIMAGPTDPSPLHMPQQPMYPSIFANAHRLSTFHSVTNPYWCKIDQATFLGTSGQNIDDIYKYVTSEDRLKMAEKCLYWRHMAPSAPDTLWSYPFESSDPFIIEKSPHVYFVGNQPHFEDSLLQGPNGQKTRVVLVPSFAKTGIVVLVNLSTLECSAVHISEHGIKTTKEEEDANMDEA